jgi:serine/threonine protein kinase
LSLSPGQKLGHFRVVEKLGEGGMGVVYRARDEHLDRDVALKVLHTETLVTEAARNRFRKEARALSKLNHPNVQTCHDFDTEHGVDFLVTELVAGSSLNAKLGKGPLTEKDVLRLGVQLAEGLEAAHAKSIVHRDLKPANLRITPEGRLKILDFGLAKLNRPVDEVTATESLTQTQTVVGTLPYMSPEQLRCEPVDSRTDVYAAGAVLYEMATGQRPFRESQAPLLINAILNQAPLPPSTVNPRVTPELQSIILKALDKDAEHRYQSIRELRVDLERLQVSEAIPAPVVQKPTRRRWAPLSERWNHGQPDRQPGRVAYDQEGDRPGLGVCIQGATGRPTSGGTRSRCQGSSHGKGGATGREPVDLGGPGTGPGQSSPLG